MATQINWEDYDPATGIGTPTTPMTATNLDAMTANLIAEMIERVAAQAATDAAAYEPKGSLVRNVKAYGAVGNFTTDDTAAIQAALTAAATDGGTVYFPPGGYKVSATLTVPALTTLRGAGSSSTAIITSSATADVITLGDASGLMDIKLTSSVARTAGYFVKMLGNACFIEHSSMDGYFLGILVGTVGGSPCITSRIIDVTMGNSYTGAGSGAIVLGYYAGAVLDAVSILGSPGAPVQPDFGLRIITGDTVNVSNCNITSHGRALHFATAVDQFVSASSFSNCLFDSAKGTDVSSAEITPAGGVYHTKFSNCWFGLSADAHGCWVEPSGAGVVDGLSFVGCEFTGNFQEGLYVNGSGVKNWQVTGGWAAGNKDAGIVVNGSSTHWQITGFRSGVVGGATGQLTGISISPSAVNYYMVTGCDLVGNTTSNLYDAGTGVNKVIANNLV